jgi:hypothetical protein
MTRLRVLSLGAGVQSTTLALMAAHGEIEPPDVAIFADTQWEPKAVYEHLAWLMSPNVLPFPVNIVTAGNIRDGIRDRRNTTGGRFAAIPWHIREIIPAGTVVPVYDDSDGESVQIGTRTLTREEHRDGMGRRQCSSEYKLEPIMREIRRLLGKGPRDRIPAGSVTVLIGISKDEAHRMRSARQAYMVNAYPLCERRMSRGDCLYWLERHGYPTPPKSACIGCPFHDNAHWSRMHAAGGEEWADVIEADGWLRAGNLRGIRATEYMHRDRVPLDQVDFTKPGPAIGDLFAAECEGVCGV